MSTSRGTTAIVALTVPVLVSAALSLWSILSLHAETARVTQSRQILDAIGGIRIDSRKLQIASQSYFINPSDASLKEMTSTADLVRSDLAVLSAHTAHGAEPRRQRINDLVGLMEQGIGLTFRLVEIRRTDGIAGIRRALGTSTVQDTIRRLPELIEVVDSAERKDLQARQDELDRSYTTAIVFGLLSTILGLTAVGLLVRKSMLTRARTAAQLADANRRKDEFLAVLAHELRNPLAPIRNAVDLLLRFDLDPATSRPALEMIDRQLRHLVRLVDDLLDVSRISRGKLELKREPIELGLTVRHAVESCRPQIERDAQALILDIAPEPIRVEADPVRIAQAVGNLVTNANRFTPRGGEIVVTVSREATAGVVAVRDTGSGIRPEHLSDVFELFTQVHDGRNGGLGIGLALTKQLAELHGGTATAESDGPGRGSRFVLRLPLSSTPPAAPAPARHPNSDGAALPGLRVLVVDDNVDAADSMAVLLNHLGHRARAAHNGESALTEAAAFRPDLVLLDLGMPGLNGYEVARRLRSNTTLSGAKLVALTGWGQPDDRRRSAEVGFDHHVVKPCDVQTLSAIISDIQRQK